VDRLFAAKSEDVGLIAHAISFHDFQSMWSQITNVTDGRTDRRHAIARPCKCTKVHCAVKTLLHLWIIALPLLLVYMPLPSRPFWTFSDFPWWTAFFLPRNDFSAFARSCDRMSSVCPSVTLLICDHIDWKSWKLIAWAISPTSSLFAAKRRSTYSQENMEKFWGD